MIRLIKFITPALIIGALSLSNCSSAASPERPAEKQEAKDTTEAPSAPAIVPPSTHPRLFITKKEVSGLGTRMENPKIAKVLTAMEKLAVDRTPDEEAKERVHDFRYYGKMRGLTMRIQLRALDYLRYGKKEDARYCIENMLDTLKRTNFGTEMDLSRASGIMLYTGGLVYDWCYSELTADEKQAFVKEFVRIAGTMESGYPPKRTEPIAGHCSEWMIMRDMLSCGIAIYDEYPDMYNYVIRMLTEDYRAPRNYFYSGGNYHQGTSYNNVRFSNDLFCQWILNKMGAGDFFSRDQRSVLYDILYRRRPDGQVLPAGDTNHSHGTWAGFGLPMFLAASYYEDPYLEYDWEKKQSVDNHCLIFRVLWQDLTLPAAAPDDLPLTRYNGSPFGWMVARTSWGGNAVIAEMKVNEHFVGNHQHLDGGSFQIYYKGPLAIDSGLYQGTDGGYNCANNKNYTKRTIAHNSLLVYDPSEVFETYNYGGADKTATAANDGGQRMPGKGWDTVRSFDQLMGEDYTVGETLAHGFGPDRNKPDYTYLKGDITKAYSSKVKDVRRSFVFMNMKESAVPAVMVVFDHVVASDPSFKKYWLLHSIEEPQISGNSFTVSRTLDGDSGMLRCDMLYPEASVTKVGGEGKEFWVFGKNWATAPTASRPDVAKEYGQWRVEESPSEARAEDIFLNVIQVADDGCTALKEVSRIDADIVVGAAFGNRAVTFSRDGRPLTSSFSFTVPDMGSKKVGLLVTDLEPGTWTVTCNGKTVKASVKVGADDGAVYLNSAPGSYIFTKK